MNVKGWKNKAEQLKTNTYALYLACRHPGVPWYAKLFTALVVGYALSPIDLIPDFIPVLGYLDDLVIVSAGIYLSLKMIPEDVLEECRERAKSELGSGRPKNWLAALVIVIVWLIAVFLVVRLALKVIS